MPLLNEPAFNFGHGIYADTGCNRSPSCLRCPLARCKYDGGAVSRTPEATERRVMALSFNPTFTSGTIAQRVGIHRRTVERIIRRYGVAL